MKADCPQYFQDEKVQEFEENYKESQKPDDFTQLYNRIIELSEVNAEQESDNKVLKPIEEEKKNEIGNLVLLDSHTNRSYHNSLFPIKRRIVIIADGLSSGGKDKTNVQLTYIPPCTRQCFTKAYSTESGTNLTLWSEADADAYKADIKEKLWGKGKILYEPTNNTNND